MSQYEKMLKNKMNDEMKLAGLEALVPEELEKHPILNSVQRNPRCDPSFLRLRQW